MEPFRHPSTGPSQGRPVGDTFSPLLELQLSGQPQQSAQNHPMLGMTEQERLLISLASLLQSSTTTSASVPVLASLPVHSTLLTQLQRFPIAPPVATVQQHHHQDLEGAIALAELIRQNRQNLIAPGTHMVPAADSFRADSFASRLRDPSPPSQQPPSNVTASLLKLLLQHHPANTTSSSSHANFSPLSSTHGQHVDEALLRLLLAQHQHQMRQQEDQQELLQCMLLLHHQHEQQQQQQSQERESNSILQLQQQLQQQRPATTSLPSSIAPFLNHNQAFVHLDASARTTSSQSSLLQLSSPRASTATTSAMEESKRSTRKRKHFPSTRVQSLALSTDEKYLSSYQILLRQQLELFSSDLRDCLTSQQGRRRRVQVHQVGLRCRHCAHVALHERGRASCYYPQKLIGIYQAAQNIATTHLAESCACIPVGIRDELRRLHQRKDTAVGGKAYWADACVQLGLEDGTDGIYYAEDSQASTDADSSEQASSAAAAPRFEIGAASHHPKKGNQ